MIPTSVQALGKLPLFAQLTPRELALIAPQLRTHQLAPHASLFSEGESARGCYVVLGGEVEVLKTIGEKQEPLAILTAGALVGHLSLVDGKPRSATCRAGLGGARVVELGRDEFDLLFRARSPFAFKILDQIALDLVARLRGANLRVDEARRAQTADQRQTAARAAGQSLFGGVPTHVHGIDLDAIEVEATPQVRNSRDRRP